MENEGERQLHLFLTKGARTQAAIDRVLERARFNGPEPDAARLTGQVKRIYELMKDGRWRTVEEIATATGDPQVSVSAQLRNLRKKMFGKFDVLRQNRKGALSEYRLIL